MLIARINEDLKVAMKNKDSFSLNVIRMIKGAYTLKKIELKRELTDDEVISIISSQIKMRKDSINEFTKAGRNDLIDSYQREIDLLIKYLPAQLSEEEVNSIIDEAFIKIKPSSFKDMGLIMREVTVKLKGKADMSVVSAIVKDRLS